jgi:hypothetical protein
LALRTLWGIMNDESYKNIPKRVLIVKKMDKKQTAVEWLIESLPQIDWEHPHYGQLVQHAKQMEKEQMIEAAERWKGTNFAEQYYNETTQLGIGAVRVRFYLCDYDEDIWAILPARVNEGDVFYMDCFVGEHEEKTLKPQTYEDMIQAILYCSSSIWGRDKNGVYQQVFLVERD